MVQGGSYTWSASGGTLVGTGGGALSYLSALGCTLGKIERGGVVLVIPGVLQAVHLVE